MYLLYKWFSPWRKTPYSNYIDWYKRYLHRDENQSVKWNKEECIRRNMEIKEENEAIRQIRFDAFVEAINYIGAYFAQQYNLSQVVGVKLFKLIKEKTESTYDIEDMLDYCEQICEVFKEDK